MLGALFRFFGLHPKVVMLAIMADVILFGGEFFSAGVGLAVTVPAGLAVGVLAMLAQKGYGDNLALALFKGAIVGFLTAIPVPLGSIGTALAGIPGLAALLMNGYPDKSLTEAIRDKPRRRLRARERR